MIQINIGFQPQLICIPDFELFIIWNSQDVLGEACICILFFKTQTGQQYAAGCICVLVNRGSVIICCIFMQIIAVCGDGYGCWLLIDITNA